MVGNDIINKKGFFIKRNVNKYAYKILSDEELEYFLKFNSDYFLLLQYWIFKEASFKATLKTYKNLKFNPKEFKVYFLHNKILIKFSNLQVILNGKLYTSEKYYHAIVFANTSEILQEVHCFENRLERQLSIRKAFAKRIGDRFNLFSKDQKGIPRFPGWDLSFSHCYPYSAWAAQKL